MELRYRRAQGAARRCPTSSRADNLVDAQPNPKSPQNPSPKSRAATESHQPVAMEGQIRLGVRELSGRG